MRVRTIAMLALTYAVLGILMNSVGVVILQAIQNWKTSNGLASTLEACKDLSVIAASFLLATRIPRFGYRHTLAVVMCVMTIACLLASFASAFVAMQVLFVVTGLSFGTAKVATYGIIGVLARDQRDHASITGFIEGIFMVGVLLGIWLFGGFIHADPTGAEWLRVYWVLSVASAMAALFWFAVKIDDYRDGQVDADIQPGFREMFGMIALPATVAALMGLFLYVLIEQGVGTWLPTFNNEVLHIPAAMSVQMSSIFIAALAAGRLVSGVVLRRLGWLPTLLGCLAGVAILIIIAMPLAAQAAPTPPTSWSDAPLAAYVFPLLGFFLAPIYPTICSIALSSLPRHRHAALIGLIVVFSALGGTLGSYMTGQLFQHMPGSTAFYFTLVPLALMALALVLLRRQSSVAAP